MSLSEKLNKVFKLGDKIEVFAGKDKLDCDGSFISTDCHYLVWANGDGDVMFTHLDGVTIKKI
ncbi:hypothetical protein [Bacillus sp. 2205SS5-2]|uniref:hypothetical protein n=1 Tax=Bacillus sp. 2205SS5-2 TaxID=3109031 RepID=UPI0030045BFC